MYGSKRKRRLHSVAVLLGPLSFGLTILLLEWFFGFKAAAALGTTVWMALWWILRPVNISVTAFVPIGVNALFDLIPMQHVISQYFSEIIVLLFGADLVCLTWATTGLDKRLAIKTPVLYRHVTAAADSSLAAGSDGTVHLSAECGRLYDLGTGSGIHAAVYWRGKHQKQ